MKNLGSKLLVTDRLELRPQTMEEQEYLWSVLMDPRVCTYYLAINKKFGEKLKSWEKQEPYYRSKIEDALLPTTYKWSIFLKDENKCIGEIDAHPGSTEDPSITSEAVKGVGWYLDPLYFGQRYASEAAKAMIDYLFLECEIDEIITGAATHNEGSWKIMQRLGFEQGEDYLVDYTFVDEPVLAHKFTVTREQYIKHNYNNQKSL